MSEEPELNLKKARFARTNQYGVVEPQVMGAADVSASWKRFTSMVNFEGYANTNAAPIKHSLVITLDLTKPSHREAAAVLSRVIWEEAWQLEFIDDWEFIDGNWINVPKSLEQLGAELEDVDVQELMKNA